MRTRKGSRSPSVGLLVCRVTQERGQVAQQFGGPPRGERRGAGGPARADDPPASDAVGDALPPASDRLAHPVGDGQDGEHDGGDEQGSEQVEQDRHRLSSGSRVDSGHGVTTEGSRTSLTISSSVRLIPAATSRRASSYAASTSSAAGSR